MICLPFLSAFQVKTRHELLFVSIGVFPEEEDAYWLATEMSWILPTIILCGGLIDILLGMMYLKNHPWKGILKSEKNNTIEGPSAQRCQNQTSQWQGKFYCGSPNPSEDSKWPMTSQEASTAKKAAEDGQVQTEPMENTSGGDAGETTTLLHDQDQRQEEIRYLHISILKYLKLKVKSYLSLQFTNQTLCYFKIHSTGVHMRQ